MGKQKTAEGWSWVTQSWATVGVRARRVWNINFGMMMDKMVNLILHFFSWNICYTTPKDFPVEYFKLGPFYLISMVSSLNLTYKPPRKLLHSMSHHLWKEIIANKHYGKNPAGNFFVLTGLGFPVCGLWVCHRPERQDSMEHHSAVGRWWPCYLWRSVTTWSRVLDFSGNTVFDFLISGFSVFPEISINGHTN